MTSDTNNVIVDHPLRIHKHVHIASSLIWPSQPHQCRRNVCLVINFSSPPSSILRLHGIECGMHDWRAACLSPLALSVRDCIQ
jgi:hypothetical protein